jgi:hypothetical protein
MLVILLLLTVLFFLARALTRRGIVAAPLPIGIGLAFIPLLAIGGYALVFVISVVLLIISMVLLANGQNGQQSRRATTQQMVRADMREIGSIASFAKRLATIQGNLTLNAHGHAQQALHELDRTLARLAAAGQLTPVIRQEFVQFTRQHLIALGALTADMQAALVRLATRYDPLAAPGLWLRQIGQSRRRPSL